MIFCPTSHRLYDSCLQLPNSGSSHTHSNNADAAKHDYQNPVVMPRWQNGWCIISWLSACIIHPQLEDVMMIGQLCFPSVVSDSLYAPDVSRHGWTTHTHTHKLNIVNQWKCTSTVTTRLRGDPGTPGQGSAERNVDIRFQAHPEEDWDGSTKQLTVESYEFFLKGELNLDQKWQSDDLFYIIVNEIHHRFNQFWVIWKIS